MTRKQWCLYLLFAFLWGAMLWWLTNDAVAKPPEVAPCLLYQDGRFVQDKHKQCRQFDEDAMKGYNARLLKLRHYQTVVEPGYKKLTKDYGELDARWRVTQGLWKTTRETLQRSITSQKENAQSWRQAFYELQKQKKPTPSWTEHPALWFTIGAVTVGVIAGVMVYVVGIARK